MGTALVEVLERLAGFLMSLELQELLHRPVQLNVEMRECWFLCQRNCFGLTPEDNSCADVFTAAKVEVHLTLTSRRTKAMSKMGALLGDVASSLIVPTAEELVKHHSKTGFFGKDCKGMDGASSNEHKRGPW